MSWKTFFGKNQQPEISINTITFDTSNWTPQENTSQNIVWLNPQFQEVLSLHYFKKRPDLAANLSDVQQLGHQTIAAIQPLQGELVEMEKQTLKSLDTLYQIIKFPMNAEGKGRVYVATYTIPFNYFSFVIKAQCPEIGTTGTRETIAINELMAKGEFPVQNLDSNMMSLETKQLISRESDRVAYDPKLPSHPLSRARMHLRNIKATFKASDSLKHATAFRVN